MDRSGEPVALHDDSARGAKQEQVGPAGGGGGGPASDPPGLLGEAAQGHAFEAAGPGELVEALLDLLNVHRPFELRTQRRLPRAGVGQLGQQPTAGPLVGVDVVGNVHQQVHPMLGEQVRAVQPDPSDGLAAGAPENAPAGGPSAGQVGQRRAEQRVEQAGGCLAGGRFNGFDYNGRLPAGREDGVLLEGEDSAAFAQSRTLEQQNRLGCAGPDDKAVADADPERAPAARGGRGGWVYGPLQAGSDQPGGEGQIQRCNRVSACRPGGSGSDRVTGGAEQPDADGAGVERADNGVAFDHGARSLQQGCDRFGHGCRGGGGAQRTRGLFPRAGARASGYVPPAMTNASAPSHRFFGPLGRSVCTIVQGTSFAEFRETAYAHDLLDRYMAAGGNCIDLARGYGGGTLEGVVGSWMQSRGNRSEVVVLTKGAHHSGLRRRVTPADIRQDLETSLAEMKTDYVDLYVLHRDDPDYPVAEVVECLAGLQKQGKIRAYGGSNWSIHRIEEANIYAATHGLPGFVASSVNFGLAYPAEPMWANCLHCCDAVNKAWYMRTQMPNFAWSSLCFGFFTLPVAPYDQLQGEERERFYPSGRAGDLARVYFTERNFARLERARKLASEYGVHPAEIAFAYVMSQPMNTFALASPRDQQQIDGLFRAAGLKLSAEQCRWLNLEVEAY